MEMSPWFDDLVGFANKHLGHPFFGSLLAATKRYPTKKSVGRLRSVVARMPRGDVRTNVLRTVDAVLFGEFRKEYRFAYSAYPKNSRQVSAASELFSLIRQALDAALDNGGVHELEALAREMVGDNGSPDVFFVTKQGRVQTITLDPDEAYNAWRQIPTDMESALENRQYGCVCTNEPEEDDSEELVVRDDFHGFMNRRRTG